MLPSYFVIIIILLLSKESACLPSNLCNGFSVFISAKLLCVIQGFNEHF